MLCDMSDSRQSELHAAVDAVRCAARVCQAVQQHLVSAQTIAKKDKSPVTVADFASQAIVCQILEGAFPSDAVVGEENAAALREPDQATVRASVVEHVSRGLSRKCDESQVLTWIDRGAARGEGDRYWTVDPIDGTKGFLRGEQYVVALALIESGAVVLGVLGCPNLEHDGRPGLIAFATRGNGSHIMSMDAELSSAVPIHAASMADPAGARFCESVESAHSDQSESQKIASRLGITVEPVRMDSQAKYVTVARGESQIYLRLPTRADYRENIWDHAAGKILVEEAGGRVTDIDGKPMDFSHGRRFETNRGVVATNGPLHPAVIAAIAAR